MGYHDEEYDGVVLKIPSWFIKMNNLQQPIQALVGELEKCKLSIHHPDHESNLMELTGYAEKADRLKGKRDKEALAAKQREEHQKKIISGEIYELQWKTERVFIDLYNSVVKINDVDWDDESAFTKRGLKSEFEKAIKSINTFDKLVKFANENSIATHEVRNLLTGLNEHSIRMDFSAFHSTQGWSQLGLSFEVLNVKYNWTKGPKYWNCYSVKLLTNSDGSYAIDGFKGILPLPGFVRKGMYLVKAA